MGTQFIHRNTQPTGANSMSNWYQFQIHCNGLRIASFMTRWQAEAFLAERAARWPGNVYTLSA
jgi:hypothetical protein